MSTKDDAMISDMLIAYWDCRADPKDRMARALVVARKAILEEALREILKASEGRSNDVAYGMHEAGRVVASLSTQEQHND